MLAHHAPSLLPILPHFNPSFPPFPHAFSRRLSVSLPPRIPRGRWNKSAPRRLQPKRTTRKKSQRPCILHNRGWEEDENGERLTLDERRHGERERRTGEECDHRRVSCKANHTDKHLLNMLGFLKVCVVLALRRYLPFVFVASTFEGQVPHKPSESLTCLVKAYLHNGLC